MYLNMFKKKYPVMSNEFMKEEILPYIAKTKDADTIAAVAHCMVTGQMGKRTFWTIRKKIAAYRDDCRIAYLTSPESEHYHCS